MGDKSTIYERFYLKQTLMSPRRKLKQQLSKMKYQKKQLAFLIDCSTVYGDFYYNEKQMTSLDKDIIAIEDQLSELKIK